jgi:hypothetical protein
MRTGSLIYETTASFSCRLFYDALDKFTGCIFKTCHDSE